MKTLSRTLMLAAGAAMLGFVPVMPGADAPAHAFLQYGGGGSSSAPDAPKKPRKTRKVPAIGQDVGKRLTDAQEALDLKDYASVNEQLDKLLNEEKLNDYERAVLLQLKAQVAFEQDNYPAAIVAYEEIISYADSIPEALELQLTFNLSQLYYSEEDFDKALEYAKRWEGRVSPEFVGTTQLSYISQLHNQRKEYRKSLEYIYRAINLAQTLDTVEVREQWYGIALFNHFELEEWVKVRDTLEILVVNWPKPVYWEQLAGAYSQLDEQTKSYSISEAAYRQGFFDEKPIQIVNVAQIMIARQAPIKATWVLEKAFKEGRVEKTARNLKTLGQAYMLASEFEKAVDPLRQAAAMDEDAIVWSQVAQVAAQNDNHSQAVEAYERAIALFRKRKDKESQERLVGLMTQRASSLIELKRFDEAKKGLKEARNFAETRRQRRAITQWSSYLDAEQAREKILAEAGISSGR